MMSERNPDLYAENVFNETANKLAEEYEDIVNETMIALDMTAETGPGKEMFEWLTDSKDEMIKLAMDKVRFEKIPMDQAPKVLVDLMKSRIPESSAPEQKAA